MSLLTRLAKRSVRGLTRIACVLALSGLAVITIPTVWHGALPVVMSMSVGQLLGVAAFGTYVLAVLLDLLRHEPGGAEKFGAPSLAPKPPKMGPRSDDVSKS